jgi:hypothetical protein
MINYTDFDPKIIPVLGTGDWSNIDRAQSIDKTGTLNKIKVEEIGRDGVVEYVNQPPSVTYRLTQMEYGSISFFNKLANVADNIDTLDLNDFKTSTFDICAFLTDDDGTFKGTQWLPKLRFSGFSINIGSPQALIQRNFDFVGEDWIVWQGANKYLIMKKETIESGDIISGDTIEFTVEDPIAVTDPITGKVIQRVVKISNGVSTELVEDTDYTYESGGTLTIEDCILGDVIKYWYTAGSFESGEVPFEENDTDLPAIHADSASIFLASGNYVYRLQSVTIDVRLERFDISEIGNSEIVLRGVRTKTVTITLGRLLQTFTIEEILAGQVADFGKLDIREFSDKFILRVYLYTDKEKEIGDFEIGFKAIDLAPSEIRGGASIGNYVEAGNTLTGQDLTISTVKATIDA